MRADTQPWWRQATADLDTARANLVPNQYYVATSYAQQAVEKGLKALILEQTSKLPPRTHDLTFLGDLVGVPTNIADALATVNPAFDITRYPDMNELEAPVDFIDEPMAIQQVAAATEVLEWLKSIL